MDRGIVRRGEQAPFTTKDGSTVQELAHPSFVAVEHLSLAEATVPAGSETIRHRHARSEEIYAFTSGRGEMSVGDDRFEVAAGDTVAIPPGTPHKLWNPGPDPLVLICACSPPYSHEDTELLE